MTRLRVELVRSIHPSRTKSGSSRVFLFFFSSFPAFGRTDHGGSGEHVVCDGGSANSSDHGMQERFRFYNLSRVSCAGVGPLAALPGGRDGCQQRLRPVGR